jgi:hypothetical protein
MLEEEVRAIFSLSGLKATSFYKITNEYDSRQSVENSWWLVKTKFGLIKIGWRKRVINIDWSDTELRYPLQDAQDRDIQSDKRLTSETVTQGDTYVHAWGYGKAVIYLTALRGSLERYTYLNSEEGKAVRKAFEETRKQMGVDS